MKHILRKIIFGFIAFAAIFIIGRGIFKSNPEAVVKNLLSQADITINGDHPWDITVHNDQLYARVFGQGSLGLGESYMDGWWDCPAAWINSFLKYFVQIWQHHVP